MFRLCQISFRRRTLSCWTWVVEGGATTAWYQILDKTKDLATRVLPRKERDRVCRESMRAETLRRRESQRESILARESGNRTPRVDRGRVEGVAVTNSVKTLLPSY